MCFLLRDKLHDLDCVFMCGLEMKCDFLIEITASSFLGNRELGLTDINNHCAVGRKCYGKTLNTWVGTSPPRRISNAGLVGFDAFCVCIESRWFMLLNWFYLLMVA